MVKKKKYPRVLIVNQQSMNKSNATGITLRSLWERWPLSSLFEVCIDKCQETSSVPISSMSIHPSFWKRMVGLKCFKSANTGLKNDEHKNNSIKLSMKTLIRQGCVFFVDSRKVRLSSCEWKRIIRFRPDVIYTLGGSVSVLDLVNTISNRLKIPVVVHFMDNWPEHLQWESNPLSVPYHRILNKNLNRCLLNSKLGIAISPSMSTAYSRKFNMPFVELMNSVNQEEYICKSEYSRMPKVFLYAGGLHLSRWKALKQIALIIKKSEAGRLDIYTSDDNRNIYEKHFLGLPVQFYPPVQHDEIQKIYERADVLVHAETNSPVLGGFFKYSISTKIPEYLSTGKPILFYGPKTMGLYNYLKDNRVAFVASNQMELYNCITKIEDAAECEYISENAMTLAKRNHNSLKAFEKLTCAMEKTCNM